VALFKLELGDKIAGAIGDALKTITHKDG